MLTLSDQINHLKKLGFTGDLTEIKKMYEGKPFDKNDKEYLKLVGLSKRLCKDYSELLSIPTKDLSATKVDFIEKKKKFFLDAIFCNQSNYIFACCPFPDVLIGSVKFNSLAYINRDFTVLPGTTLIIGRENSPQSNLVMIANNCTFGLDNEDSDSKNIIVDDDVWVCAGASVKNGVRVGRRSVISLGALVDKDISPEFIAGGVPCKEIRKIEPDYISKHHLKLERTDEEIEKILRHLNTLGFNGDMTEYVKMLNGENYNCLQSTMIQISNFTHDLCTQYSNSKTTKNTRKEIIDVLFPFRGKDFEVGQNIYMDILGCCTVGNNVKIGNNVCLAGNNLIGNNVTIGDNCIIQGIGHDTHYLGRRLQQLDNGQLMEICTSGAIQILDGVNLESGTLVSPNTIVKESSQPNTILLSNGKVISREDEFKL